MAAEEAASARASAKEEECAQLRKQLGDGLDDVAERVRSTALPSALMHLETSCARACGQCLWQNAWVGGCGLGGWFHALGVVRQSPWIPSFVHMSKEQATLLR